MLPVYYAACDNSTEVHPTVLRNVTADATDSKAHAVQHAEAGERRGPNRYIAIADPILPFWQSLRSGCLIHNSTYLTLSLTLTITLTLLTLTVTVRVTLTLLTILTQILDTVVNKSPTSQGLPPFLCWAGSADCTLFWLYA